MGGITRERAHLRHLRRSRSVVQTEPKKRDSRSHCQKQRVGLKAREGEIGVLERLLLKGWVPGRRVRCPLRDPRGGGLSPRVFGTE